MPFWGLLSLLRNCIWAQMFSPGLCLDYATRMLMPGCVPHGLGWAWYLSGLYGYLCDLKYDWPLLSSDLLYLRGHCLDNLTACCDSRSPDLCELLDILENTFHFMHFFKYQALSLLVLFTCEFVYFYICCFMICILQAPRIELLLPFHPWLFVLFWISYDIHHVWISLWALAWTDWLPLLSKFELVFT